MTFTAVIPAGSGRTELASAFEVLRLTETTSKRGEAGVWAPPVTTHADNSARPTRSLFMFDRYDTPAVEGPTGRRGRRRLGRTRCALGHRGVGTETSPIGGHGRGPKEPFPPRHLRCEVVSEAPSLPRFSERRSRMLETSKPGDGARPRPGDVVLRKEDHAEGPRYTLRQFPAAPQLACSSRDRALTCATVFARTHGVCTDPWRGLVGRASADVCTTEGQGRRPATNPGLAIRRVCGI